MNYLITFSGVVRTKVYINLILFKIVRGWRADPFHFSTIVDGPKAKWRVTPRGIPLALEVETTKDGAHAELFALGLELAQYDVSFPEAGHGDIHWEPLRGVVIDGAISFSKMG